jgi:hypothetical protein
VTNRPEIVAFNQELLAFYSLGDGDWTLSIDGKQVATASAWEWENGINLAFNVRTPQYLQAQNVLGARRELSRKRYLVESVYPNLRRHIRAEMGKMGLNADSALDRAKYFGEKIPKQNSRYVKNWEGLRDSWDRVCELMAECEAAWPEVRYHSAGGSLELVRREFEQAVVCFLSEESDVVRDGPVDHRL